MQIYFNSFTDQDDMRAGENKDLVMLLPCQAACGYFPDSSQDLILFLRDFSFAVFNLRLLRSIAKHLGFSWTKHLNIEPLRIQLKKKQK